MVALAIVALVLGAIFSLPGRDGDRSQASETSAARLQAAFDARQSDIWVEATGEVVRVLPDDLEGSRHQRFIVRLRTGQTLLVAHNIDLAPRVSPLSPGDEVSFRGEYAWNAKGGVVHWTHHDPSYRQVGGWIEVNGRQYR